MSAKEIILTQIKNRVDMYAIPSGNFNGNTQVDLSGVFPSADTSTYRIVLDIVDEPEYISTIDNVDPFDDDSGVALYRFNGDANDDSGNYNGVSYGGAFNTGVYDRCFQVTNSMSDRIEPNLASVFDILTEFTISGWYRKDTTTTNEYKVLFWATDDLNSGTNFIRVMTYATSDTLLGNLSSEGVSKYAIISGLDAYANNTWHHCTFTFDGTLFKSYLNGNLIQVTEWTGTTIDLSGSTIFRIGNTPRTDAYAVSNSIDQLRIFNRALTESEINTLYQEKVPR